MSVGTIAILVILAAVIVVAVVASRKHMKGQGGCCGGSSDKVEKKKLEGEIVSKKIVHIENMHCENCKNTIERQLDRLDGVAAEVNLKKKIAVVTMTKPVPDAQIEQIIERMEYQVTGIETEAV